MGISLTCVISIRTDSECQLSPPSFPCWWRWCPLLFAVRTSARRGCVDYHRTAATCYTTTEVCLASLGGLERPGGYRVSHPSILLLAGRFSLRGTCQYTLRLAEHLPSYGFDVSVVCPDARLVDRHRREDLHIQEIPFLQAPLWSHVALRMLWHQLAQNPPDLIHIQSRSAVPQGVWLARKLRRPFVLTAHDYQQPRQQFHLPLLWCRKVIAVSEAVRNDLLLRAGIPEPLVTVIHSGVDCSNQADQHPILSPGVVSVIGTAGPLEAVKGLPFFLGAAARVLATGRAVEFLIAGAGPEEDNLRRLASELGINDHVTFVPNLLDFSEALQAMDIFILPSLQQGIGTIMLEAMAWGRPVIATKVGGVYQVVRDQETGLLVPPSDSAALAAGIMKLLDQPDRARTIGAAARDEVLAEFNSEQMLQRTADLYRDVLHIGQASTVVAR